MTDFQHPITTPASLLVDHWASRLAGLGAGLTDLVADALMLWEVLHSFLGPPQRYSSAYFQLGVALLESSWRSADAGRTQCARAADDIGKLLVQALRSLSEADPVAAKVAANELLLPRLHKAAMAVPENGRGRAAVSAAVTFQCEVRAVFGESVEPDVARDPSDEQGRAVKPLRLEPLRLFETAAPQIRILDPIFHEEGDRPQRGAEVSETTRLKKQLHQERRAAARQLARDASVVQQLQMKKETKRRAARTSERARVRSIMDGERAMLAKLKTESGGGMDTSLGSYSKEKDRKKANKRVGGNATDDTKKQRMGTPKDERGGRAPKRTRGGGGQGTGTDE